MARSDRNRYTFLARKRTIFLGGGNSTRLTMGSGRFPPPLGTLDDCDRPACDDMVSMLKKARASATTSAAPPSEEECPPKSGALGTASWTLLHSMVRRPVYYGNLKALIYVQAAWYPDNPTAADRLGMSHFFLTFARFYPCTYCAADFQENLAQQPVRTESRTALCQWLCEQHNLVNAKLGKPLYPCDMETLDQRWRKNDKCN